MMFVGILGVPTLARQPVQCGTDRPIVIWEEIQLYTQLGIWMRRYKKCVCVCLMLLVTIAMPHAVV